MKSGCYLPNVPDRSEVSFDSASASAMVTVRVCSNLLVCFLECGEPFLADSGDCTVWNRFVYSFFSMISTIREVSSPCSRGICGQLLNPYLFTYSS